MTSAAKSTMVALAAAGLMGCGLWGDGPALGDEGDGERVEAAESGEASLSGGRPGAHERSDPSPAESSTVESGAAEGVRVDVGGETAGQGSSSGEPHGYTRAPGPDFGGRGTREPRVRPLKARIDGPLKYEPIRRIVWAHNDQLLQCYREGLDEDPNVGGRIVIKFVIGADGHVSSSDVETSVGSRTVDLCMATVVRRWKFPKPRGGATVTVIYPFSMMT